MSHLLFLLALAFVAWRWFAKGRSRATGARPEGGRRAPPPPADDGDSDEIADVAKAVSSFLGEKGFLGEKSLLGEGLLRETGLLSETGLLGKTGGELLGQAVSRALQESGVAAGIERRAAEVIKPARQAAARQAAGRQATAKAVAQVPGKHRARYLLDGDGGYRQRSDRTARLEQSFRGKGLCSPR